jgi:uncharacterized protein (TIGR02452 family)
VFPDILILAMSQMASGTNHKQRREISASTLATIESGSYAINGEIHDLIPSIDFMKGHTTFYPFDSPALSAWKDRPDVVDSGLPEATRISVIEKSTLEGTRMLHMETSRARSPTRVGVLNFASAKNPGGGFLGGAQAQVNSFIPCSPFTADLSIDM